MLFLLVLSACGPTTVVIADEELPATDSWIPGGDSGDSGDSGDTGDSGEEDTSVEDTGEPEPAEWCFPGGVLLDVSGSFAYGASFDSYDSRAGLYGGGNIGKAATVMVNGAENCALTSGASVAGDAWVGGEPADSYCEEWGASVSGGVHAATAPEAMPAFGAPVGLPDSQGDVYIGWAESLEWSEDGKYDSFRLGYGATMTVWESVTVLAESFANEGAPMVIAPGSVVNLYVQDDVTLHYGAAMNVEGKPEQLNIYLLGSGTVSVGSGASINARIYAPEGTMATSGTISGAWVARTATAQWGAWTHVDIAAICP